MGGSPSRPGRERGDDLVSFSEFHRSSRSNTGAALSSLLLLGQGRLHHEDASRVFAPSALQVGANPQSAFHFAHGLAAFRIARLFG